MFLAVVAVMVVDVMGQIACPNRMSTDQLRSLSLVQQPVEQLIQKVTDTTLAGQVYDCVTKDGINCAPCRQGELGQIMGKSSCPVPRCVRVRTRTTTKK